MAISTSDIQLHVVNRPDSQLVDGGNNNLFPDKQSGSGVDYAYVEVWNAHPSLTLSAGQWWLTVDPGGAAVYSAVADGTARATSYSYGAVATPASWSTAVDSTTALTLPTLAPGQKCLVGIKRDTAGASNPYLEINRINVSGTSPI